MKNMHVTDTPLVVDLDGTLLRSDLLHESFLRSLLAAPLRTLHALLALIRGKAAFKAALAEHIEISAESLPYNPRVVDLIRKERDQGRLIFLASASDQRLVRRVADNIGLFDGHFASDGHTNLSGRAKARLLSAAFGNKGFDYIGNAKPDLHVWKNARKAILVNPSAGLLRRAKAESTVSEVIEDRRRLTPYVRSLRPHQWLKNLLIFLPVVTAHELSIQTVTNGILAFVSFSLCASSAYLINDMLDIENDRKHHSKKHRPIASGNLPILHACVMAAMALATGFAVAIFLPLSFLMVLSFYVAATLAYSLLLKQLLLIDVIALGGLYTTRVIAGGEATTIPISPWLLAFSMLLFFCLALVKRHTELVKSTSKSNGKLVGRGYEASDVSILLNFAAASGYGAVIVLGLYISSPIVMELYKQPYILWLVCVLLLYWISRVLVLSHRGKLHDDPVVFAATDRTSWVVVAATAALVYWSAF